MKIALTIILLIFCGYCKSQAKLNVIKRTHSLIIFSGESNSGGKALNSSATEYEKSVRTKTKILNNNTLLFESLDIPVNNIIGHAGYNPAESAIQHGWELGLANAVDSGTLPKPTYIVKTGQGGSWIATWSMTGAVGYRYWYSLTKRVDRARLLLSAMGDGSPPQMYLFWSQGINDINVVHTSPTVWKDRVKTHFANLRARYGFMPIFMTLLPTQYFSSYNPYILEIANEVSDCYAIQTSDATGDGVHWDYAGQKKIIIRMIWTLKNHYSYY